MVFKMRFIIKSIFYFFLIILFLLGCSDSTGPNEDDSSRIMWGTSIDGIEIDDPVSKVLRILGEPDEIAYGDFWGDFYIYTQGEYSGLTVAICNMPDRDKTVVQLWLKYPYSGTTKDKIGIGSSKKDVRLLMGTPHKSIENSDNWYYADISWRIIYSEQDTTIETIIVNKPQPVSGQK